MRHARRTCDVLRNRLGGSVTLLLTVRISPIVAIEFENIITSIPFGPLRNVSS
jgi:hypothetical protein